MASLQELAELLVDSADRRGKTPVITLDEDLRIADAFFFELGLQIGKTAQRPWRWEVLQEATSLRRMWRRRQRFQQLQRVIAALHAEDCCETTVESRLLLSRPAGPLRSLAIGIADWHDSIPSWGHSLRLTTNPTRLDDVQLMPLNPSSHVVADSVVRRAA